MTKTTNETPPTVLLVDDNPETLRDTEKYFERTGLNVVSANSPFGVTNLVQRHNPDAIVLDVMMPGLNGDALASLIRKECEAPIIYFSAMPEEELRDLVIRTSNSWYVLKSEGLIYLNEVIERRLRSQKRRTNSPA
jgi:DNA-binding response OmpR family regulator